MVLRGMTVWTLVLAGALSLSGGCGDDSSEADNGGPDDDAGADADADSPADADAEADAEAEEDDGGGTGTLTVLVLGPVEWPDYAGTPIAGAQVAFDRPDGTRVEDVTDATGHVAFDDFDWGTGNGAATAYADGYGPASIVGLDGAAEDVTLELTNVAPWPREGWVEVSGTASNLPAGTMTMAVYATVPSVWYAGAGPDWSISLPPGVPFTVVAMAAGVSQSWLFVDHGPVGAAATVDLDFAGAIPASTATGSFPLPARTDSRLRTSAVGQINVQYHRRPTGHGWFERLAYVGYAAGTPARSADGASMEYGVGWVEPTWAAGPSTRFNLLTASGSNMDPSASTWAAGYPTAGPQAVSMLDAPELVTPSSPTMRHPLHDPIEWELFDTGVQVELQILRDNGGNAPLTELWAVRAPLDATSLVVPALPTGVAESAVLGGSLVQARLRLVSDTPAEPVYLRMATSARFLVEGEEEPTCATDLTDWFDTTDACWQCTAEHCCAEADALDAARDDYDAYLALILCSHTNCGTPCPPSTPCGVFGMPGLMARCAECIDANCCAPLAACTADTECAACYSTAYLPPTCCENAAWAAFAGCMDTSCADECASCVDCRCGP